MVYSLWVPLKVTSAKLSFRTKLIRLGWPQPSGRCQNTPNRSHGENGEKYSMVIVVIKTASDNICYTQKFKWATNGFALTGPIVVIAKYLYGEIEKKFHWNLLTDNQYLTLLSLTIQTLKIRKGNGKPWNKPPLQSCKRKEEQGLKLV